MDGDEPITDSLLRVLRYAVLVEDGGSRLTEKLIDAFARTDPPAVGPVPMTTAALMRSMGMRNKLLGASVESTVEYMKTVGWLRVDASREVVVTDVGRAVVRASVERNVDSDEGVVIISPDDPLNYAKVTRAFVDAGSGMLVDPYFKDEQLDWLYKDTRIEKILFCRKPDHLGMLELSVGGIRYRGGDRDLDLRYLPPKSLHDRYVFGADGSVSMLGCSLNGLRRNFTALIRLPPTATEAVRAEIEPLWEKATPIEAREGIDSMSDPGNVGGEIGD